MFIQTEQTPNPATLKFLPGRDVMATRQPISLPLMLPASRRWLYACLKSRVLLLCSWGLTLSPLPLMAQIGRT